MEMGTPGSTQSVDIKDEEATQTGITVGYSSDAEMLAINQSADGMMSSFTVQTNSMHAADPSSAVKRISRLIGVAPRWLKVRFASSHW